ncbi:HD-GYP domain-containing protein [Bacillus massiliigorillae]|uniref:HD-GYP domain-containing protein n=1 Tax=Bacillus massiliigorillae TaxID=1243664 RepID=UPI0003A6825B|nr:HD-GYP domain-containing protein [Bacillus massiliigorillae]
MRLVSTEFLKPETVLGKTIYNTQQQILLNEGVSLTERMITRLRELGIQYVYIKDARTNHIQPFNTLSEKVRKDSLIAIETSFTDIHDKESIVGSSIVLEKNSKKFMELIRTILDEIKDHSELLSILSDVHIYDEYIFIHSFNVTLYSLAIGIKLGLSQKDLEILGIGAILHDVGKMYVPYDILMKPGKLTQSEYIEMQKHTDYGFHILKRVATIPLLVAHCAFQHHERVDGTGYPRGLLDKDIHLFGKIIAVADVFDAVTSNRVYRQAMLPHEGLEILYAGAGTLFDSNIVETFRKAVAIYPLGLNVVLNNNKEGVVSKQNDGMSDRPVITILKENGKDIEDSYELDLKQHLDIMIIGCDITG